LFSLPFDHESSGILGGSMTFNERKYLRSASVWTAAFLILAVGTFFYQNVATADNNYFALSPTSPFSQDWTNTGLITTNDDWSGVPSITGYLGDYAPTTAPTGVDPQILLQDMTSTTVDVIANQSNPNSVTAGGTAEFELTNPVVALQGSGTADAPHIDIRLNTTGCSDPTRVINVSYNLRDIDSSADNAIQSVALQYRVGATGDYTNVPAGYIPDATTGPNLATLVSPVFASLPADAKGQTNVHVRILTTNAVGSDEWVGVDDINITCAVLTAAAVNLGGRVVDARGRGIRNAVVTLSGANLGQPITLRTSSFGYYRFEGVAVGETYVVSVAAKRYNFSQPNQVVSLVDEATETNFVADPLD
jgi:hypothetical protein